MPLEVFAEATPQKENATDAAAERETIISWSDADQVITIDTSRRPEITSLSKNPGAVLIQSDGTNYRFELPLGLITIRNARRAGTKRVLKAEKCGATKADGTICQMVAKKDTGKCRWHS